MLTQSGQNKETQNRNLQSRPFSTKVSETLMNVNDEIYVARKRKIKTNGQHE